MADMTFFEPVIQFPFRWRDMDIMRPVFYPDYTVLQVLFSTPVEAIAAVLPSHRLQPMRLTPRRAVTAISVIEHRESGIGPYTLAAIAFPVTVDRRAPIALGLQRAQKHGAGAFMWQMPETSHVAVATGVGFAGYPKFMAAIDISISAGRMSCQVAENDREIFTLSAPLPDAARVDRRWLGDMFIETGGWIRRVPYTVHYQHAGASRGRTAAELVLGDHPVADELRSLHLGRPVAVLYAPDCQQILGSVMEGWRADRSVERWAPTPVS